MQPVTAQLLPERTETYVPEAPSMMFFDGPVEAQDKLAAALADAMAEFSPIYNADAGQMGNRHFRYASLDLLRAATLPALTKRKILVLQPISGPYAEGVYRITTMVIGQGARIVSILEFTRAGTIQEFGSQQTYLRRYAYRALFLLDGSDDIDNGDDAPREQSRSHPATGNASAAAFSDDAPRTVSEGQKSYSVQDIAALHTEIQRLLRELGIREPKAMQLELEKLSEGKDFNRNPLLLISMRDKLRARQNGA